MPETTGMRRVTELAASANPIKRLCLFQLLLSQGSAGRAAGTRGRARHGGAQRLSLGAPSRAGRGSGSASRGVPGCQGTHSPHTEHTPSCTSAREPLLF